MNQAILFNDDLHFNAQQEAWSMSGLISGQKVQVYFHSFQLKQLDEIDTCAKFDLEEFTELWLESNEPEQGEIHIQMK